MAGRYALVLTHSIASYHYRYRYGRAVCISSYTLSSYFVIGIVVSLVLYPVDAPHMFGFNQQIGTKITKLLQNQFV